MYRFCNETSDSAALGARSCNLLTRGGARIIHHDRVYELDQPPGVALADVGRWFHRQGTNGGISLFGVTEAP